MHARRNTSIFLACSAMLATLSMVSAHAQSQTDFTRKSSLSEGMTPKAVRSYDTPKITNDKVNPVSTGTNNNNNAGKTPSEQGGLYQGTTTVANPSNTQYRYDNNGQLITDKGGDSFGINGNSPVFNPSNNGGAVFGPTGGATPGYVVGPTNGAVFGPTSGAVFGPSEAARPGYVVGPTNGAVFGPTSGAVFGPSEAAKPGYVVGPTNGAVFGPTSGATPGYVVGPTDAYQSGNASIDTREVDYWLNEGDNNPGYAAGPTSGPVFGPTSAEPSRFAIGGSATGREPVFGPSSGSNPGYVAPATSGPTSAEPSRFAIGGSATGREPVFGPSSGSNPGYVAPATSGAVFGPTSAEPSRFAIGGSATGREPAVVQPAINQPVFGPSSSVNTGLPVVTAAQSGSARFVGYTKEGQPMYKNNATSSESGGYVLGVAPTQQQVDSYWRADMMGQNVQINQEMSNALAPSSAQPGNPNYSSTQQLNYWLGQSGAVDGAANSPVLQKLLLTAPSPNQSQGLLKSNPALYDQNKMIIARQQAAERDYRASMIAADAIIIKNKQEAERQRLLANNPAPQNKAALESSITWPAQTNSNDKLLVTK